MLELFENTTQLTALVGYDADGNKTVISICTHKEIAQAVSLIFEGYPQTTHVGKFDLTLTARAEDIITRESVE